MIYLNNKDKIFLGVVILGIFLIFAQKMFFTEDAKKVDNQKIIINNIELMVEVVDDEMARYQGLSGREKFERNEGMLFVHDELKKHRYVMREMKFDLDFIFIKDDEIVDIAKNVSKDFEGTVQGATEYNKILEVLAGWVEKNGVELGDRINYE